MSFILLRECWSRENGAFRLELVVVKDNERALRMYKSFGFQITGTHPRALRYPDETFVDEYLMMKML